MTERENIITPKTDDSVSSGEIRRANIEAAAFALLKDKGYSATSMLAIAREAGTSNQTMYKLYKNKQHLFGAMVTTNVEKFVEAVSLSSNSTSDPLHILNEVGSTLLDMLLSEDSVVLNRAAVGDVSDTRDLGPLLAHHGRAQVFPIIEKICQSAIDSGQIEPFPDAAADATNIATIYLDLLIGDLQIRRASGSLEAVDCEFITRRAARAMGLFSKLLLSDQNETAK